MPRPESPDDLTPDQRRGPEFASFDLGEFPVDGVNLLGIAGEFLDTCKRMATPVKMDRDFTRINCYATPSAADLQRNLETAQHTWATLHGKWLAAKSGAPKDHWEQAITDWCTREGLELPWEVTP